MSKEKPNKIPDDMRTGTKANDGRIPVAQTDGLDDPNAGAQGVDDPAARSEAMPAPGVPGDAKVPPPNEKKMDRLDKPNRPDPAEDKAWREARRQSEVLSLAHGFAAAMLQNPQIDIFLYGSPLEAGTRGEHKNAGALLAQGAKRLAEDYLTALEALHRPAAPAPEAIGINAAQEEAGHPTNDFPLD